MKIKLLKDNMFHKAGHVYDSDEGEILDDSLAIGYDYYEDPVCVDYTKYPDFFQVIDEDAVLRIDIRAAIIKHYGKPPVPSDISDFVIDYLREKGRLK